VLRDDDPPHGTQEEVSGRLRLRQNFRLPQGFWTIVAARRPDGTLAVAAFHFDQAALLALHDTSAAGPGDFISTVAQIEALTGLDFGSLLRDAPALDLDDA
jgi:DNA/RNA endonuclease G (NUC1)